MTSSKVCSEKDTRYHTSGTNGVDMSATPGLIRHTEYTDTPANTKHNKHVIIDVKRCFDAIITCLLCFVIAGHINQKRQIDEYMGQLSMSLVR